MSCKSCIYYETGDDSVGMQSGCTHDILYDKNGNIIDEMNDLIVNYMSNDCPLKESEEEK